MNRMTELDKAIRDILIEFGQATYTVAVDDGHDTDDRIHFHAKNGNKALAAIKAAVATYVVGEDEPYIDTAWSTFKDAEVAHRNYLRKEQRKLLGETE